MTQDAYSHLFKVLIVGSSGVGKTSLLVQYTEGVYNQAYRSTIGVDFKMKTIVMENETIKLQLWDTAGQERFRAITSSYYRNAHGIILVFDVTDKDTFKDLRIWINEISNNIKSPVVILILGNKIDEQTAPTDLVSDEEISRLIASCTNANLLIKGYRKVSAKTSAGVNAAFEEIAQEMKHELAHTGGPASKGIQLETDESVTGWCCIG